MTYDTHAPAGVAIAPDGSTLYVSENDERPAGARELRAYRIRDDGSLGAPIVLHAFGSDRRGIHRGIEGLCVDAAGNVIACAGSAASGPGPLVYVFSPKGAVRATWDVPEGTPLNCAFGDARLDSLYVSTVEGHLYRVRDTGHTGYLPFTH
jgi:gluconolactonase